MCGQAADYCNITVISLNGNKYIITVYIMYSSITTNIIITMCIYIYISTVLL